jgi:hypothetical protein
VCVLHYRSYAKDRHFTCHENKLHNSVVIICKVRWINSSEFITSLVTRHKIHYEGSVSLHRVKQGFFALLKLYETNVYVLEATRAHLRKQLKGNAVVQ